MKAAHPSTNMAMETTILTVTGSHGTGHVVHHQVNRPVGMTTRQNNSPPPKAIDGRDLETPHTRQEVEQGEQRGSDHEYDREMDRHRVGMAEEERMAGEETVQGLGDRRAWPGPAR